MPIYEYLCMKCGHQFDALRAMRDADASIACTKCQSDRTKRQISVFSARSEGRVAAGNGSNCKTCRTHTCSTCGSNPS